MDAPGLSRSERHVVAFRRRFGTVATVALVTAASVALSVALMVAISLMLGTRSLADMAGGLTIAALVPLLVAPVGSTIVLRLVGHLDSAYADLARLTSADTLTGVATRRHFFDEVEQLLPRVPADQCLLVAMVDLDEFKKVNDTYGHATGDAALVLVGRRLSSAVEGAGPVGRLGGDEFATALAVPGDHAPRVRRRIDATLTGLRVGEVPIGVSVGYAVTDPRAGIDAALSTADADLYRVKAARGRRSEDVPAQAP